MYRALFIVTAAAILLAGCQNLPAVNSNTTAANTNTAAVQHDMSNMGHDMSNMAGHDMSNMANAAESAPGAASQPYDLQFLDSMIHHHDGAVQMAKMVLGK